MKKNKIDINTKVKRVSNIILNSKTHIQSICCVNFGEDNEEINCFIELLAEDLKKRNGVGDKEDYRILNMHSIINNAEAFFEAGKSDATLIFIKGNEVNGNQAIDWKRELELNGANILGAVYFQ